jgi:hypothetical protein
MVSAAKGLEIDSNKRMSQVIADEISPSFWLLIYCARHDPDPFLSRVPQT